MKRYAHLVHTALAMAGLLAVLLACGGGRGPAQTPAAAPDREHQIISLCEDLKEPHDEYWCLHLARAYAKGDAEAHIARDLPRAIALYDHFCDVRHDGTACLLAGSYRARGQAQGDADPWFAKACRATTGDSYFDKADVDPAPCTKAAKSDPAAAELHRLGCARRETESCVAHGSELLAEGRREDAIKVYGDVCFFGKRVDACVAAASADTAEISTYLRNACELGDAASCTKLHTKEKTRSEEAERRFAEAEKANREAQSRSRAPTSNRGDSTTTVTMQSANVNGLSVVSLTCDGVSGGMLAPLTVTAALGERATALHACGVHGTVHVTWTSSGGAIDTVTAAPTNACVVSALRASKLSIAKRCTADLAL